MSLLILVDMLNSWPKCILVDGDAIRENVLFCKTLPEKVTGEEVFPVTSEYLEIFEL